MADIFAPPTKQELALFAPPTQEELKTYAPPPEVSSLEALARGGAQGASLGFADEIAGGLGAGKEALSKGSLSELVKDYIAKRDAYRQGDEAAKTQHGNLFTGGELAGGVGTAFIPGLNIAKGATMGARIAGAAALGGVAGLGTSKADLTQGDVGGAAKDTAIGAGTGAILQPAIEKVVAPAVGYAAGKVKDFAGAAGKKALNVFADVPEAVTQRYLDNPEAVNNALSKEGVSQKLADTLGDVRRDTGPAAEAALSSLSNERIPRNGLEVDRAIKFLEHYNDPDAIALKNKLISEYQGRVPQPAEPRINKGTWVTEANQGSVVKDPSGLLPDQIIPGDSGKSSFIKPSGPVPYDPVYNPAPAPPPPASPEAHFLTEREMHDVKKTLQGLTDWKKALPTADQAQARMASGDLNQTLKTLNPDYQSAMQDLSANIGVKNELAGKFGIKPDFSGNNESGYTFTDRTVSALKDLIRGNKVDRKRIIQELTDQGYGDLGNDIQNTLAKEAFNTPNTNGSRKAVMGAAIGGYAGHSTGIPGAGWVGAAAGSAVGGTLDKYGPQLAKKALDVTIMTRKLSQSPETQKFVQPLMSAAQRGQGAVATTHFILSQTQPAYQKAMEGGVEGEP